MADVDEVILTKEDYPEYWAGNYMYMIFSPILLVVGLIGNLLSFKILSGMLHSQNSPTAYYYLAVLSIVDILALYIPCLDGWISHISDKSIMMAMYCGSFMLIYFLTANFSVYIIINMTIDRFIGVFFPFQAKKLCTKQRAQVGLVVVFIVQLGVNLHLPWTLQRHDVMDDDNVTSAQCFVPEEYKYFYNDVWLMLDFTIYSFFPFALMAFCNIAIVYKMGKQTKMMHGGGGDADRETKRAKKQRQTNVLLMAICAIFLVTTSPVVILHMVEPNWDRSEPFEAAKHNLFKIWALDFCCGTDNFE